MTSSGIMETVEYRAVIRFLFLKGRTPTETFNEMKETYGEDVSSSVVGHQWKRLPFPDDHILPLMKTPSGKWRQPFWRIAAQPFVN